MNAFQSMVQSHIEKYKTPMIKGEEVVAFKLHENAVEFQVNSDLFVYKEDELEQRLTNFLEQYYYENGDKEENLWINLQFLPESLAAETGDPNGDPGQPGVDGADTVEDFFKTVNETGNAPVDNTETVDGDIAWAKRHLEKGLRVTRRGWIGWLQYYTIQDHATIIRYSPFWGDATTTPISIWIPTPADILATDYILI